MNQETQEIVQITTAEEVDAALEEIMKAEADLVGARAMAKALESNARKIVKDAESRLSYVKAKWEAATQEYLERNLKGKKRYIQFPHGRIGVRKQPLRLVITNPDMAVDFVSWFDDKLVTVKKTVTVESASKMIKQLEREEKYDAYSDQLSQFIAKTGGTDKFYVKCISLDDEIDQQEEEGIDPDSTPEQ